ncbi:unnamed protein product [Prunus armeniaca]|uniref:Uncharacterized protein n=1 Tax=Prunus armeniaca TaxID=36596 RepID=A0A6J5XP00_PRUAR|nr:unnamed protein product [Prunus armeniaca]CAB4314157.1 unnamed protein product [Prunus armeniaca]
MAGKDYLSIAMTVEEWERGELTPPHLLAEDEEEKDERNLGEQVLGKETKKGREGGSLVSLRISKESTTQACPRELQSCAI